MAKLLPTIVLASLCGWPVTLPLAAQERDRPSPAVVAAPLAPVTQAVVVPPPDLGPPPDPPAAAPLPDVAPAWETLWGVVGLRAIPNGLKVGPNGARYHPNFSMDGNFSFWVWRPRGLYLFGDARLWGETGDNGSTNARDGFLGTSKRQVDLSGGAAWNYAGFWELRGFGYTFNNLNRGTNPLTPTGFHDGFAVENRYYLSDEYARLGQTGFDVTHATFLSVGYFPSKDMAGNDGSSFRPGLLLRAYLVYDLGSWPCYLYGDFTYISERDLRPRLLLFDTGLAARPLRNHRQWEMRLGTENVADVQVRSLLSLWYGSLRYIF